MLETTRCRIGMLGSEAERREREASINWATNKDPNAKDRFSEAHSVYELLLSSNESTQ